MIHDQSYTQDSYHSELKHLYSKNIHILNHSSLKTLVAKISSIRTHQPYFTTLIKEAYSQIFNYVIDQELEVTEKNIESRMSEAHPEQANYKTTMIKEDQYVTCVDLARAGMIPTQLLYEKLHFYLDSKFIRQDHIYAARVTDENNHVVGVDFAGSKIAGAVDEHTVIFSDPMGATGSTLCEALNLYKKEVKGSAKKFICIHLIITPEYIKKLTDLHPEVIIYAARLDRGLSSENVLSSIPGAHQLQERGLNDFSYIVPGAGGIGEILNNSFV